MKIEHIKSMIGNSFLAANPCDGGDWANDVAIKIYFYPLCSALLTDAEMESIVEPDDLTIKDAKATWIKDAFAARLAAIVQGMVGANEYDLKTKDMYLTVIVYGAIIGDNKPLDFCIHFNTDEVEVGTQIVLMNDARNTQRRFAVE